MKRNLPDFYNFSVAIIGLGYVGLPLAVTCSENIPFENNNKVIGFDINKERIKELKNFYDRTNEIDEIRLKKQTNFLATSNPDDLLDADIFIVTVPTPINEINQPDLKLLKLATGTVAEAIKAKKELNKLNCCPIIIYESTVFPGATEEICSPIIEETINGELNKDFFLGYSPERINPGDSKMKIENIIKVTSGSNNEASDFIDKFYSQIIKAGTHKAINIKTAETSKVLENTQRDINIALINELAIICNLLKIDTTDVLEAASTKWNFLNFKPGLVGGHCIGVDPYYLTYKSKRLGYRPEMVIAGRKINDGMAKYISESLILKMIKKDMKIKNSELLLLGLTFKENIPDHRNSQSIKIYKLLKEYGFKITVIDPIVNKKEVLSNYGISVKDKIERNKKYDVLLLTVAHDYFKSLQKEWQNYLKEKHILYDLKNLVPRELNPWRL